MRLCLRLLILTTLTGLLICSAAASPWQSLAPGLEYAEFGVRPGAGEDSVIAVLRADPLRWKPLVLSASARADSAGMSTREWAHRYDLTAAINAGMYDRDLVTHVGELVTPGHANNPRRHPRYQSLAVFDPVDGRSHPFRILDLDLLPRHQKPERWSSRVQNLRLIRRSGENRWSPGGKRWSEAALAEDDRGRILLLYCPVSLTMHEFNERLLELPLRVVAAQHLEGGLRAQLYVRSSGRTIEFHTGRRVEHDGGGSTPPGGLAVPNVLGLVRRSGSASAR